MVNIEKMRRSQTRLGLSYDWDRQVISADPGYYRWNQWIFLKLLERGLAYRKTAPVNWCPVDKTVLANEQISGGVCWRCGSVPEVRDLAQWFLKITDYAERLLDDMEILEWPDQVLVQQRNWIGRSKGAEVTFEVIPTRADLAPVSYPVFTTRPDTLWGATFFILAPEHPLAAELVAGTEYEQPFAKLLDEVRRQTEVERVSSERVRHGMALPAVAINPVNGEELPVWTADYVLSHYGTGAIMAVPAHDQRDFEFARTYDIPIRVVVEPETEELEADTMTEPYTGPGVLIHSGPFTGTVVFPDTGEGVDEVIAWLEKEGKGHGTVNYRLRDWLVSRQRYWGTPIPIVYCPEHGEVPVPEEDLPVLLPEEADYTPTDDAVSPLANATDIYGVRVTTNGDVLDPVGIAISTDSQFESQPRVASNGSDYLVVWNYGGIAGFLGSAIHGAVVTRTGTMLEPHPIVVSSGFGERSEPAVASDGENYLVVWTDTRNSNTDIYASRITGAGKVLDPLGIPVDLSADPQESPSVASNGEAYVAVWQSGKPGGISGTRISTNGFPETPNGMRISETGYHPAVASNGTNYLVVWQDARDGTNDNIYGARVTSGGVVQDTSGIQISTAAKDQYCVGLLTGVISVCCLQSRLCVNCPFSRRSPATVWNPLNRVRTCEEMKLIKLLPRIYRHPLIPHRFRVRRLVMQRQPVVSAVLLAVLFGAVSLGLAVASVAIAAAVVVSWPADRFKEGAPASFLSTHPPPLRALARVGKNLAGLVLLLLGAVMALPGVPGQGILTMIIGLTLVDFPGKLALERRLVSRPFVLRKLNALRHLWTIDDTRFLEGVILVFGPLLFSWLVSFWVGVNQFSLHSLYRNRLIRGYLGASRFQRHPNLFSGFDPNDNFPMYRMRPEMFWARSAISCSRLADFPSASLARSLSRSCAFLSKSSTQARCLSSSCSARSRSSGDTLLPSLRGLAVLSCCLALSALCLASFSASRERLSAMARPCSRASAAACSDFDSPGA